MSQRHLRGAATTLCFLLGVSGCGSGGGGSAPTAGPSGSSPALGVFVGYVLDDVGSPVEGARVSVDGIEAEALTGPDGLYRVCDSSLAISVQGAMLASGTMHAQGAMLGAASSGAAKVEVAVIAPGMEPVVSTLEVSEGSLANVDLVRSGLEPDLTLTRPRDYKVFLVSPSCPDPAVTVEGFARLGSRPSYRLDVVVLLDRSGSTKRPSLDVDGDGVVDSVLDAEIAAARCFLEGLDPRTTRVCAMAFNDSVSVLHEFSSDFDAVGASVDLLAGGSSGGTNFDAAFQFARDALGDLKKNDDDSDEPDEDPPIGKPEPFRAVVFLSDGIATSHGIPRAKSDSNLTQSSADRAAAIASAASLGAETSAQLFAYSFLPVGDTNKKRTTLPHCIAACGGGRYEEVNDIGQLSSLLCAESLVTLLDVEILNVTTGAGPFRPGLRPDGFFSQAVPVALGDSPSNGDTVTNELDVKLTAYLGSKVESVSKKVNVKLMSVKKYEELGASEILDAQAAPKPVSELKELKSPQGKPLKNDLLYELLVGSGKAEFEDAIELQGVETITANDPLELAVTLKVDFVFKDACYHSDFGYFFFDPAKPPKTAFEALADPASAHALCNTWDIGQQSCSAHSIPAGQASFESSVPSGSAVGFFLLPNQKLAGYLAAPMAAKEQPLFTLSSLNPAGFDQAMTFRSLAGRTEPGASGSVVTTGPLMIFALEDISTATRSSDQDFNDLVFTVGKVEGVAPDAAVCGD